MERERSVSLLQRQVQEQQRSVEEKERDLAEKVKRFKAIVEARGGVS